MKNTYLKKLFLTLILGGVFLLPQVAEGKSVSWSWNDGGSNTYSGYEGGGWIARATAIAGSVRYEAKLFNDGNGQEIVDNATIPTGTIIRLEGLPHQGADISWNGTGTSWDTPNGDFIAGAASPTNICDGRYFFTSGQGPGSGYWGNPVYYINEFIALSVTPPTKQYNVTGPVTALGGNRYSVTGPGSIVATVTFQTVSGKMYYASTVSSTSESSGSCGSRTTPMKVNCPVFSAPYANCSGADPDFSLNVPQQSITFNLTAISTNNNPNPPSLTGPTSGSTSTSYPFNTQATDPDSDTIHYGMDWDNNSTVDEWMPASGYVPSNTTQTFNHSWATPGTYTIKALTQDSKGGTSGWSTPLTITISTIVNGVCGSANAFPTTNPPTIGLCFQGANTPVTPGVAPGPYSWTCQGSGGGTNAACTAPYLPPAPDFNLQINGVVANGSLTVARNANLNIIWNNVTNATSCSGTGNSWTGSKATVGGNDNIQATAASLYQLSCTGPGGTTTKNISVTLQPTLKICQNSCSGSIEPPASFSMNRYDTKNLVACFNDAASCTDSTGDVTTSATWSEGGGNPISISGGSPKTLTADNVGTESFQASYNSNTVTRSVTVTCTDAGACQRDSRSQSLCQKDTFTVVDNCGQTQSCTGEKTCDYNWKEVEP